MLFSIILLLEKQEDDRMVYSFLNSVCPVCDKPVDSYNYKLIDGKKYHIGCTGMKLHE